MKDLARELKRDKANVSLISLWSNAVRTEEFDTATTETNKIIKMNEWLHVNMDEACSPDFVGQVVVKLATEPSKKIMARSGEVCLTSDLALQYNLSEADGRVPAHARSLRNLLISAGYPSGKFIPSFVLATPGLYHHMISHQ
ncbi:unnamed protein product [Echinostoma caproni]|uniref:Myosin motor domain-containing protein n=1 Tax=Echinostoma caproni TaxID=27848 RepID=A0A183AUG7_9TREM|nr:unnamed protein product [Echinostoma caproni]